MSNTTGATPGGPGSPQGGPVPTRGPGGLRREDLILFVLTGLLTLAISYVGWQISKVSDLASEIHNTNGRIDQIYPLIAGAAGDIGSIKGTLEVASQKISAAADKATAAADRAEALSKTLTELAKAQNEQIQSVHEVTNALSGLIRDTKSQQDQIDNIDKYIRSLPLSPPVKKTEFLSGAYVYTSMKNGKDIEYLKSIGADLKIDQFDDPELFGKIVQAQKDNKIDMKNFFLVTKEPVSAKELNSVWTGLGK